jgi:hypothetical protein
MITYTKNNTLVPIHGELASEILSEQMFISWIESCDPSWQLQQITVQSIDRTPGGKTLFIKIIGREVK